MIEKFTEGASGSFFYFSEDSRLIVKTLELRGECLFFRAHMTSSFRCLTVP